LLNGVAFHRKFISELLAIWDHTCSVICHLTQVNCFSLTPARQASTRFTCPGDMEGCVDFGVKLS